MRPTLDLLSKEGISVLHYSPPNITKLILGEVQSCIHYFFMKFTFYRKSINSVQVILKFTQIR